VLPELPLNLNGKVDRRFLESLKDHADGAALDSPADETETALAAICSDLLKRARPALTDNLFDHGLTSLKVMEMISRIRNELRADVSLLDVYTFPTIKSLSRRIGGAGLWKTMKSTTESLT
jgi:aryl carrier-like protein